MIGTVPVPGGVVTLIVFPELVIETLVPEVPPKVTVVPFSNPAPVMTRDVPPVALPEVWLIETNTGV